MLAPWHVRFKASYRQCMAIGTSQREGSKLPGVLEATAGDLWSWYNWATEMGTKSPLSHLRRSFPFQATSPVIFHSCGYPVYPTDDFQLLCSLQPAKTTPRTINSQPGWDADKFITAWDVATLSSGTPQFVASWVLSRTKRHLIFSCKRCPGKKESYLQVMCFPQLLSLWHHVCNNIVFSANIDCSKTGWWASFKWKFSFLLLLVKDLPSQISCTETDK